MCRSPNEKVLSIHTLLKRRGGGGRPVLLDGAVGTELDNRGMDTSTSLWSALASFECPELLEEIHSDYVDSGAEIITTSTFRTTMRAFARENQPDHRWLEAAQKAVRMAVKAAGKTALVAGSVAPLEDCFSPEIAPQGEEAAKEHALLCNALVSAGVDILWLETFGTLGELGAAISSAREAGEPYGVPFVVSATTNATGDMLSGESLSRAFGLARDGGAKAFSINCIPATHVDAALEKLGVPKEFPIGVYANLGHAEEVQDWSGSAYLSPEEYADLCARWVEAGVSLIGGCRGSTPAHIKALSSRFG